MRRLLFCWELLGVNFNYLIQTRHKDIHFLSVLLCGYNTPYIFHIYPVLYNPDKCKLHSLSF